jgi:hypothetical protein
MPIDKKGNFRIRQYNGISESLNAITFLWENPCSAPYFLYVETALPFVGKAALRLIEYGALDMVRAYFRPASVRGNKHFGKGRKRTGRRGGIPDSANLIARYLPGAEEFQGRQVSDGVRHLWMIDGIGQRILLSALIGDIIDDTLQGWSQALSISACRPGGPGGLIAEKDTLTQPGLVPVEGVPNMTVVWPNPGLTIGSAWSPGPRGAIVSLSAQGRPALAGTSPKLSIRIEQDNRKIGESSIGNGDPLSKEYLASGYGRGTGGVISGLLVTEGGPAVWDNIRWTVNSI